MKYTIKNLRNDFPDDEACLDFILYLEVQK